MGECPVTCSEVVRADVKELWDLDLQARIWVIFQCRAEKGQCGNKWVFPKMVVPQNGWFIMETPIKMDDLEVPLFLETPKYRSENTGIWIPLTRIFNYCTLLFIFCDFLFHHICVPFFRMLASVVFRLGNPYSLGWSQGKVYGFVPMGDSNPDTEVGMKRLHGVTLSPNCFSSDPSGNMFFS